MKVWFVDSARDLGGGELWMLNAAAALRERGHEITIVGRGGGDYLSEAQKRGLSIIDASLRRDYHLLTIARLRRLIKRQKPDVIFCAFNRDLRNAGVAARGTDAVVVARHGLALIDNKPRHRRTMRLADAILTNSQSVADLYAGFGWFAPGFVQVIHNGVADLSAVAPHDFTREFPGRTVALAAGRLVDQKGFDVLLRAFAQVRGSHPEAQLAIAGDGPERETLERLNAELGAGAAFLGRKEDLPALLRGCALFVLSSRYEGMPNVVLEAMSAGRAVVATNVQGVGELVADGQTGLLAPPEDPDALAQAISRLLADDALREQMGVAGQTRVRERFSLAQFADNLEAWLEQLCRR